MDANDNAKLVDLGESVEFQSDEMLVKGSKGTPGFLPPELVDMENPCEECKGVLVDIWALGVTLYGMLFGDIPFNGETKMILYDNIVKDPLSFPDNMEVSENCKDLLNKMLEKAPEKRYLLMFSWIIYSFQLIVEIFHVAG